MPNLIIGACPLRSESGHARTTAICLLRADCVTKVFLAFGRTNEQQRFKRTDAPIRLLQISISQSLLGDFCNTICQKATFALQQIYSITSFECEQLVGNIEAEFLKLARMDDVRRSRVLDHAAARNSARRRAPDRGAVRVAFACGGRARPIPKPLRIAMKAKQDRAGTRGLTVRPLCGGPAARRRVRVPRRAPFQCTDAGACGCSSPSPPASARDRRTLPCSSSAP